MQKVQNYEYKEEIEFKNEPQLLKGSDAPLSLTRQSQRSARKFIGRKPSNELIKRINTDEFDIGSGDDDFAKTYKSANDFSKSIGKDKDDIYENMPDLSNRR